MSNDNLHNPNVTYLRNADLPVERAITGAIQAKLKAVTIVGREHNGELYCASTHADAARAIFDLECMKHLILSAEAGKD